MSRQAERTIRIGLAIIALFAAAFALNGWLTSAMASTERLMLGGLTALGLLIAGTILYRSLSVRKGMVRYGGGSFSSQTEKELLVVCGGDRKQAERLIRYHSLQVPGSSRRQAARRAIDALRRDRR